VDYIDDEARSDFEQLGELLQAAGVPYVINPRLVRGLDYYNKTVFEWVTDRLGAQGTVCAGGRYDGLVEQLGGRATPAAGFAMGLERLVLLMLECGAVEAGSGSPTDVYAVAVGEAAEREAMAVLESLREHFGELAIVQHRGGGSFKSQLKRADKSGARVALIWGEDEVRERTVTVKLLRESDGREGRPGQQTVSREQLEATLQAVYAD